MIISFAWTTDALLAGRKTCTRRDWNPAYAAKFTAGKVADAYDHLPRAHGKKIGDVQIKRVPYPERLCDIPDEDYEGEGLKFMEEKGLRIRGVEPIDWFNAWRDSTKVMFVVRFDLVFPCDRCGGFTTLVPFGPGNLQRLCPLCWAGWEYYAEDHGRQCRGTAEEWRTVYREFCNTKGVEL